MHGEKRNRIDVGKNKIKKEQRQKNFEVEKEVLCPSVPHLLSVLAGAAQINKNISKFKHLSAVTTRDSQRPG